MNNEEKIISTYARKEAIEDGFLVDVSETCESKEAGFKAPICLTAGVHALVEVPESLKGIQDYRGRLWDTLYMAASAFRVFKDDKHLVPFQVIYQTAACKSMTAQFWLVFNELEGFTIMLPEEY